MSEIRPQTNTGKVEYSCLTATPRILNQISKIPKQVTNQTATVYKDFTITFIKNNEYFHDLIEDIIIEYKGCAGNEQTYYTAKTYKYTYLKTYVSIGIPSKLLTRMTKDASDDYHKVETIKDTVNNGYTWITASITETCPLCYVYSEETQSMVSIGNLFDIVTRLKSNVLGHGRFNAQVVFDHGKYFLKFTLTGFQLMNKTEISSTVRSFAETQGISEELRKELGITADITNV